MKFLSYFLLSLLTFSVLAQKKELQYADVNYEPTIKTVQLYPIGASVQNSFEPAVIKMDDRRKLILEFDDLREDADYYYVYFIHCNADWTPSDLRPNMYVNGYNEFEILDFEFSSESRIRYVHYYYEIPRLKQSGNYMVVVYRNQNKDDIVLTRRFSIYDNQVGVGARVDRSATVANRRTHQRLEASVNYGDLRAPDPSRQFTVVFRQNERPDRVQYVQPTYIDETAQLLRYQNLDDRNEFHGGNEFRHFDLSTVNFGGRNIANTQFINNRPYTDLMIDRQAAIGYLINLDINGKYYIRDLEGRDSRLTSEYVNVKFSLDYEKINNNIHLVGNFNNWEYNEDSKMKYNPLTDRYENTYLLKQGWYDYAYMVNGRDPQEIERSFYETENLYEVFVYFRPMGARGDQLVGYYRTNFNRNR